MQKQNKTVLTIATGKSLYIRFAINLIRSFLYWNPKSEINFSIVTDLPNLIPEEFKAKIKVISIAKGEFGEGFSPKLYLDKFASDGQTLFIDSDCLIFGRLDSIFEKFQGKDVSVVGSKICDGDWFGNISRICHRFSISSIPKFNGGVYYLEKGEIADMVYAKAREIEKKYDEIGFLRLRNRPNDEVIMALAMQLHNQDAIIDDGTIMSDPQACPGKMKINILTGERILINPSSPHPNHQSWYPFNIVSPLIVHFLGYHTQRYPYKRESYRIKLAFEGKLNLVTELQILTKIQIPEQLLSFLKSILRPIYRKTFGTRRILPSERL